MTAEAVALNKFAVAMAADSTVTLSTRRGMKTYDTANKLFELIKGIPVGVMIYANAELNGVPWETIIKAYRESRSASAFETLAEYADDFVGFLNDPDSFVLSRDSEIVAFESIAFENLIHVFQHIEQGMPSCVTAGGKVINRRLRDLVATSCVEVEDWLNRLPDGHWPGLSPTAVKAAYGDKAKQLVEDLFGAFGLPARTKSALVQLTLLACTKEFPLDSDSGLVIAGFGERDVFPSYRTFMVRGRIAGVTCVERREDYSVTFEQPGHLRPFAQDEMAYQWITGINWRTRQTVIKFWSDWVENCVAEVTTEVRRASGRIADRTAASIASALQKMLDERLQSFFDHMNEHQQVQFLDPLTQSVALLPKEELALMAESMVNLESLRQRTSVQEMETVGGAIDVALISRGDGFVWLKRKHYFGLDLNPAWPWRHSGTLPVMATAGPTVAP